MHHAALDSNTPFLFLRSWAHICKQFHQSNDILLPDQLKPFYDRSLRIHKREDTSFTEICHDQNERDHHKQQQERDPSFHMSTFSLTCAYTWVCLVKVEQGEEKEMKGDKILAEGKGLLGEDGLVVAVNAISEAIKGLDNGGVLNGAEDLVSRLYLSDGQNSSAAEPRRVHTTGSHRFDICGTDFGWRRPRSTEVFRKNGTGAITFSDGKNGGGAVDIGLVLEKHHMEAFASLYAKCLETL
ncbi:unnamed protein product [Malus baccata var. baccata]